jgi:hypothetical protein
MRYRYNSACCQQSPLRLALLLATAAFVLFPVGEVFGLEPDSDELLWLSKRYPQEVFDYCLDTHPFDPGLKKCLSSQSKIRKQVLVNAIDQLGTYAEARALYDDCKDYHPLFGVVPIGECVATRLILRDKLDFAVVEQLIYEKCEQKWRKSGVLAVRNCAAHSANSYLEKGRLPDW